MPQRASNRNRKVPIEQLLTRLEGVYGRPRYFPRFEPVDEFISCILSQHSTDIVSFPAFFRLKNAYPDWNVAAEHPPEDFLPYIREAGLANQKARAISNSLKKLRSEFGEVTLEPIREMAPLEARSWLEQLPGVGPKTASIVLCFSMGMDITPVDTHVMRVCSRIGVFPPGTTERKAHDLLIDLMPEGLSFRFHMAVLRHGRAICKARNPKCSQCPVKELCSYYEKLKSVKRAPLKVLENVSVPTHKLMTEAPILLGEYPDVLESGSQAIQLSPEATAGTYASAIHQDTGALLYRFVNDPTSDLAKELSDFRDHICVQIAGRFCPHLTLIALGPAARKEVGLNTGYDLLLMSPSNITPGLAEEQASSFFGFAELIRASGLNMRLRLHLRIPGFALTERALRAMDYDGLTMPQRFALGSSRTIYGAEEMQKAVRHVAYAQPLSPERLKELVLHKKRLERELLPSHYRGRHIELGHGGMWDLEWIIHLLEMRFPTATEAGFVLSTPERIKRLARMNLVNAVEAQELELAFHHMSVIRHRIVLLDGKPDLVPENPDKLQVLASLDGLKDPNEFLLKQERIMDTVRQIYLETLERLKA